MSYIPQLRETLPQKQNSSQLAKTLGDHSSGVEWLLVRWHRGCKDTPPNPAQQLVLCVPSASLESLPHSWYCWERAGPWLLLSSHGRVVTRSVVAVDGGLGLALDSLGL